MRVTMNERRVDKGIGALLEEVRGPRFGLQLKS